MNKCEMCGIEVTGKAKTCSPRCRMALSRQASVTAGGSVTAEKEASVTFSFTVGYNKKPREGGDKGYDESVAAQRKSVRTEKYWYDVPLAAIPVIKKDWPKMPKYMNGRQYFLWWKNDFKKAEDGSPVIHNPFPARENVTYVQAGQDSRRWGA